MHHKNCRPDKLFLPSIVHHHLFSQGVCEEVYRDMDDHATHCTPSLYAVCDVVLKTRRYSRVNSAKLFVQNIVYNWKYLHITLSKLVCLSEWKICTNCSFVMSSHMLNTNLPFGCIWLGFVRVTPKSFTIVSKKLIILCKHVECADYHVNPIEFDHYF